MKTQLTRTQQLDNTCEIDFFSDKYQMYKYLETEQLQKLKNSNIRTTIKKDMI